MTFPFHEKVVNDKEYTPYNFKHPNFIGYLTPEGHIFKYDNPLGLGGHNDNKLTSYFETFFRMPINDEYWYQEGVKKLDILTEKIVAKDNRKRFENNVQHNQHMIQKYGLNHKSFGYPDTRFMYDLDLFFYNCYQAETFMEGFGKDCSCLNHIQFYEDYCEGKKYYLREHYKTDELYKEGKRRMFEYEYHWYKKELMLDWYKTVIVQYMHYHLIDRCGKGITTSSLNPNETFYNYIINGFTIHQIPRMIYEPSKKKYVEYTQSEFFVPDSEVRLLQEAKTIYKRIKPEDRYKYYR